MWIKRLPADYYEQSSSFSNSLMLWRKENVYVMDNHLSAAWCWLQSCDPKVEYNFMHIDMHYDLLSPLMKDIQPLQDNPHMSYDEFKNLKRSNTSDCKIDVFRCDNYIMAIYALRPNWFKNKVFLTQSSGTKCATEIRDENPLYLDFFINYYICKSDNDDNDNLPWIVNLDLDIFYTKNPPHIQLHSDEYIRHIARLLNKGMPNIQVLTIAMSPDWMGGKTMKDKWDNAFRILKIMAEEIPYLSEFPFPEI